MLSAAIRCSSCGQLRAATGHGRGRSHPGLRTRLLQGFFYLGGFWEGHLHREKSRKNILHFRNSIKNTGFPFSWFCLVTPLRLQLLAVKRIAFGIETVPDSVPQGLESCMGWASWGRQGPGGHGRGAWTSTLPSLGKHGWFLAVAARAGKHELWQQLDLAGRNPVRGQCSQ